MPPFPNLSRIGLTFDHDLWPTNLNIDRGHLLIKDYLSTKLERSGAKRSWVISCTRWSRLVWPLTWISIGIIYSSRTIYLPSLKLLGQSVLESSVAQGEVNWHDLWPWPLHQGLSTYQVWSFWGKAFLSYQLHKVNLTGMTFDLDLWPTDLKIKKDHILTKDYLRTKFDASGAKRYWVISCTRLRATDIPTDRHTDQQVQSNMPSFFKGGHKND